MATQPSSLAILFATRQGHTADVAAALAGAARARGMEVVVHQLTSTSEQFSLAPFSAVLILGSVHLGEHEAELVSFVRRARRRLARIPSAFVSVSLTEATVEAPGVTTEVRVDARIAVGTAIQRFIDETRWVPDDAFAVAGALRYTRVDPLTRIAMKRVARRLHASTDTSRDHVLTDWSALEAFLDRFLASVARASRLAGSSPPAPAHPCARANASTCPSGSRT